MMAYLAILVALIGLLLYALSSNTKVAEVGRILFFCGALATVLKLAERNVRLF